MPRTWNDGMMENWNVDIKEKLLAYLLRSQ